MIRARERGMSYWPFVIALIALIVMTYMWYETNSNTDKLVSDLAAAKREKDEVVGQLTSTKLTLDELQTSVGFAADDGRRPDGEKARARLQEFVSQTGDQLTLTMPANKWTATGEGGRVEELADGNVKVHYFPPVAELSGETMTLENVFPHFVDAVKRMQADIQNAMSLKSTTEAQLANLKTEHATQLAAKDNAIGERQSQIQALQAQLAQQGSELRDQIATLEGQVDSARTELEEFRTQSETAIAKLENQVSQGEGEIKTLIDREKPFASEGPDGEILAARDLTAWVNLGKRNLLMPGTVFTVLGRKKGGALYAKATVKITMVDETMAKAAVMALDSRADPIVEGDLVQSTTYSPNRQLRFFLLGEFSSMGKSQIEARLEALGAKVDDAVSTETHYLVLGTASSGGESLESSEDYKKAMQYGTTILTEAQLASFTDL